MNAAPLPVELKISSPSIFDDQLHFCSHEGTELSIELRGNSAVTLRPYAARLLVDFGAAEPTIDIRDWDYQTASSGWQAIAEPHRLVLTPERAMNLASPVSIPVTIPPMHWPTAKPYGTLLVRLDQDLECRGMADVDVSSEPLIKDQHSVPPVLVAWHHRIPVLLPQAGCGLRFAIINARRDHRGRHKALVTGFAADDDKPSLRLWFAPLQTLNPTEPLFDGADLKAVKVKVSGSWGAEWTDAELHGDMWEAKPRPGNRVILGAGKYLDVSLSGLQPRAAGRWGLCVGLNHLPGYDSTTFVLPFIVESGTIRDVAIVPPQSSGKAGGRAQIWWRTDPAIAGTTLSVSELDEWHAVGLVHFPDTPVPPDGGVWSFSPLIEKSTRFELAVKFKGAVIDRYVVPVFVDGRLPEFIR